MSGLLYFALTAGELAAWEGENAAWMACRFASGSDGLSNLPDKLPPNSLLILNDQTPAQQHNPARIQKELQETLEKFGCPGLLLAFERKPTESSEAIAKAAAKAAEDLGIFCAVPESYLDCGKDAALFLPMPAPLSEPDFPHSRPLVLELAPRGLCLQITEKGAKEETVSYWELSQEGKSHTLFRDKTEKYDYFCKLQPGLASYSILETAESLQAFWENVCKLPNVLGGVGLYQELAPFFEPK